MKHVNSEAKNAMLNAMLNYLQSMMDKVKEYESRYGEDNDWTINLISQMIACKEMTEALICEPVNLGCDGKVTVGF